MKKISGAIILGVLITSCGNMEKKHCSKDCEPNTSPTNIVQGNDRVEVSKLTM